MFSKTVLNSKLLKLLSNKNHCISVKFNILYQPNCIDNCSPKKWIKNIFEKWKQVCFPDLSVSCLSAKYHAIIQYKPIQSLSCKTLNKLYTKEI